LRVYRFGSGRVQRLGVLAFGFFDFRAFLFWGGGFLTTGDTEGTERERKEQGKLVEFD
jgi:hypothetical protein